MKLDRALVLVVRAVLDGAKQATAYRSPTEVVNATFFGKRLARARGATITVTIGKPDYRQREFIRQCKRAGEPFPVRKLQVRFTKAK